ncbi:MAG: hypothetical protein RID91_19195 [Azospirillaceae bacterium]
MADTRSAATVSRSAAGGDVVTLAATDPAADETATVTLTIDSALMNNQQRLAPIDPTGASAVVEDAAGRAMIFSIGNDGRFYLTRFTGDTETGWRVTDLQAGFGKAVDAAVAFDVSQDSAGRISLAVAFARAEGDGAGTAVFVAYLLGDGEGQTDWTALAEVARPVTGLADGFAAERLRVGSSEDGAAPLVVVAGAKGAGKDWYLLRGGAEAERLAFPEDVDPGGDSLLDISLGYAFGQRGIWFLYRIGDSVTLECTTLADDRLGSMTYDYSPGNASFPEALSDLTYTCIATPTPAAATMTGPSLCSDIYIGAAEGIFVIPGARAGALAPVATAAKDVHEIRATEDGDGVSLWAMAAPATVHYVRGRRGDGLAWDKPVVMSTDTVHIAPLRSRGRAADEAFLVRQGDIVTHVTRDAGNGAWRRRDLVLPASSEYVVDAKSFTTHVNLVDENRYALGGRTVKVRAGDWVHVLINGVTYGLDRDVWAEVETDAGGTLTLIALTGDLAAPTYEIASDDFAETITVYPAARLNGQLQGISSGKDITGAETRYGDPVVAADTDATTADSVAGNVAFLSAYSASKMGTGDAVGIVVTPPEAAAPAPASASVAMASLGGGLSGFGISVSNGVASVVDDVDGAIDAIGDAARQATNAAGDVIQYLDHGLALTADGTVFLFQAAEEGVRFVIKTAAEEVYSVVLDSVPVVMQVLGKVLEILEIVLETLLAWLGFVFPWIDIWETAQVLSELASDTLDWGGDALADLADTVKAEIGDLLDGVAARFRSLSLSDDNGGGIVLQETARQAGADSTTDWFNSPGGNWARYLGDFTDLSVGFGDGAGPDLFSVPQAVIDAMARIEALATDFEAPFRAPGQTVKDAYDVLLQVLDDVIEGAKAAIEALFDTVVEAIRALGESLKGETYIPVLTELVDWVAKLLGTSARFSIMDGAALLAAIPATYVYRMAAGKAPFAESRFGFDEDFLRRTVPDLRAAIGTAAAAFEETGGRPASMATAPVALAARAGGSASNTVAYSQIGGLLASTLGVLMMARVGGLILKGKVDLWVYAVDAVRKALTFPMPSGPLSDAGAMRAWGLRFLAYMSGCAISGTFYTLDSLAVRPVGGDLPQYDLNEALQHREGPLVGLLGAFGLVLMITANALDEPSGKTTGALTWTSNVAGGVSAIAFGVGMATDSGYTMLGAAGLGFVSAAAGVAGGSISIDNDRDTITNLTNVGFP